jgi:hypothetical protein
VRVQNSSISPPKNDYAATEPSNPPVIIEICTRFFTSLFEPFTRDALPFARSQFQEIKNEGPWAYTSKICIAFTKAVKEQPLDTAYYATGAIAHLAGANPMMEGAFAAVHFCKKARDLSNLQMPFPNLEPCIFH